MKIFLILFFLGCTQEMKFQSTEKKVNLQSFMGKWYVITGRFTRFEKGAHNAIEEYKWNEAKKRIDISFTYNKDSLNGKIKSIPQKGWVENNKTNSHWKISPLWPFKLDYLILDVAKDYSWTAIGVPSGNYLWVMARDKNISDEKINQVLEKLKQINYPIQELVKIPHS